MVSGVRPAKLSKEHKASLARLGGWRKGPIRWSTAVVRWRACDLIMRLHEEVRHLGLRRHGLLCFEGRLGFRMMSALPKADKQDPEAMAGVQKDFPPAWPRSALSSAPGTSIEVWRQDEMRVGEKNKLTLSLGQKKGLVPARRSRSSARNRPTVRRRLSSLYGGAGAAEPATAKPCSSISMRSRSRSSPEHTHTCSRSSRLAWRQISKVPSNITLTPLRRARRTNGQDNIGSSCAELALKSDLQILRRYRRSLLLRWKTIDQPWKMMSIARRDGYMGYSM